MPKTSTASYRKYDLLPEAWGGQTITVNCSAVTNEGIKELLEMLALQAEVLELKANPKARARGTVIESEMHKGLGAVATVLVQNGTLHAGDAIVFGEHWGRIKTMQDELGNPLTRPAPPLPSRLPVFPNFLKPEGFCRRQRRKRSERSLRRKSPETKHLALQTKRAGLENLLAQQKQKQEKKILHFILRADVQGSLKRSSTRSLKIASYKVQLNRMSSQVGEISESDIQLASASKATIYRIPYPN